MKKNSFLEGAMISTLGIVICKIIGILYVIPFRAIIGTQGAILYSYAYTIYSVFVSLSSTGIPSAMAKTVSEYNTLEYYDAQERAYKIGKWLIVTIGIICFLILFIFAPQISYLIIGDLEGGNTIGDITYVIRIISTALLFIPILSISKGYVQGHRMMSVPSIANVVEQIARVIVIIFGSYFVINVLHLSITTAVGIATFGATVGAMVAYLYVLDRIKKNKEKLFVKAEIKQEEKQLTNKIIFKKIVMYSLPFILIEFVRSIYNTVDVFTVVKTLVSLGYDIDTAENVLSIVTTWGSKLNQIILSLTIGLAISIIPNLVRSITLKDYKDASNKINQALKLIMFISLPMTLGISFLSKSVWTIFYGYDVLSVNVFKIYILQALVNSFFYILVDATNALNKPVIALSTLFGSFLLKAGLNIPIMHLFNFLGIEAYYGIIATTIFVQLMAVIFLLIYLKKSYNISYKDCLKTFMKTILLNIIMMIVLIIVKYFIGDFPNTRLYSMLEIILYGSIGVIIYGLLSIKWGLLNEVFGDNLSNILKKIKK